MKQVLAGLFAFAKVFGSLTFVFVLAFQAQEIRHLRAEVDRLTTWHFAANANQKEYAGLVNDQLAAHQASIDVLSRLVQVLEQVNISQEDELNELRRKVEVQEWNLGRVVGVVEGIQANDAAILKRVGALVEIVGEVKASLDHLLDWKQEVDPPPPPPLIRYPEDASVPS